ncbi:DUF6550 family protein [Marasmitruncus massiliensis]|uniref:DUF6550 family protein n=1 Tax=Marasmitruncus massiliensis TaxID=1944642 RepID=UPI001FA8FB5C|nr:DUF6550 family protein [Marasmitruncus massiliensis]
MKKLSDKNKRWLTIAGLGVMCVALVIAISSHFHAEKPKDNMAVSSPTVSDEVNVKPESDKITDQPDVTVPASEPSASSSQASGSGVSSGTKQTIQSDVSKPEAPKETPKPQGDTTNQSKAPAYKPENTEKKSVENKQQGGLPGFDNVPDGGANQGSYAGDMYENGNKIGKMN